jgi:DNA-binding transcriptional MerR regulator
MTTQKENYSIGDTARITGVSQKQLRNWEARGYITPAMRIVCGQRAYRYFSRKQVEIIKSMKRLMDEGYALAHASRLAKQSKGKGDV